MKSFFSLLLILLMAKAGAQGPAFAVADSLYTIGNYSAAINTYAGLKGQKAKLQIARSYAALGNTEKAVVAYQSIITPDSTQTIAMIELGKLLAAKNKTISALPLFVRLTVDDQSNAGFFYHLGKTQLALGNFNLGKKALQEAIDKDKTHLKAIYVMAKHLFTHGEPSNAKKIINLGLQTAPKDVALLNLKALVCFENGNYKEAAGLFNELIALGEKKPFIFKKLGFAQNALWETQKAVEAYRQMAKFPDYTGDAYLGLGAVYLKAKQLDSAAYFYNEGIKENTVSFSKEYASLGHIYKLKGNLKKAMDYYTLAWEEDTTNPYFYYQICTLADAYYEDPKTKLGYYERLLEYHPELVPYLKERAKIRITELKEEIHFAAN